MIMINILFVISNLNPQGPINQLFYLCKYLNKHIFKLYIVTTSQRNFDKTLHDRFDKVGVQVIDLKLSKLQSVFYARKLIQNIIDDNYINIIQSFGFRSDIISCNLKRTYTITTVRNTLLYNWRMIRGPFLGPLLGWVHLHFIRKYQSIVACSHSVHKYLKTLDLESDVIVNSIDLDLNTEALNATAKQCLRMQLNLPVNSLIFTTVSSKLKGKNIEFLIKSFINMGFSNHILIIAGFVNSSIKSKFRANANIFFIGKVDNFLEYLKASDYFISASLHEGMPNAVLEAMSVGTPIILSDIPPHREIFESSPMKIGHLFENNNLDDLKAKIAKIKLDNHSLMSYNCILTVNQYFYASNMASKYGDYYLLKSEGVK